METCPIAADPGVRGHQVLPLYALPRTNPGLQVAEDRSKNDHWIGVARSIRSFSKATYGQLSPGDCEKCAQFALGQHYVNPTPPFGNTLAMFRKWVTVAPPCGASSGAVSMSAAVRHEVRAAAKLRIAR